jgi:hypothetical protein
MACRYPAKGDPIRLLFELHKSPVRNRTVVLLCDLKCFTVEPCHRFCPGRRPAPRIYGNRTDTCPHERRDMVEKAGLHCIENMGPARTISTHGKDPSGAVPDPREYLVWAAPSGSCRAGDAWLEQAVKRNHCFGISFHDQFKFSAAPLLTGTPDQFRSLR